MKNKPLQQNLSCTGNSGLWTVPLQYQQYKKLSTSIYCTQKVAHGFGLFKLIWENILKIFSY